MAWQDWQPPDPARMARTGLVATVLGIPLLVYDAGRQGAGLGAVTFASLTILVLGALLAVTVLASRLRGPAHTAVLYAWSLLVMGAIAVLAIDLGGDPRRYGVLYGTVIGLFAVGFPSRGQVIVQPAAIASYAAALLASPLPADDVVVQLGLVAVLAYVAVEICMRLRRVADAQREAVADATRHAGLASALSRLTSLDPDELMDRIVDAVRDLDFELAHIGVIRDGLVVPERHRGFAPGGEPYAIAVERGLVGVALRERRTVAVDDYLAFERRLPDREGVRSAIAVPLLSGDEPIGVLVGARGSVRPVTTAERDMLEVLATHAGHAIANARRYESERANVRRLTEVDRRRTSFVSNVSHELRTPLTVIHGLGETLAARGDTLGEAQRRELLSRLTANSERLSTMVATLLELAQLEAGSDEVRPGPVPLLATVTGVVGRLEPLLDVHVVEVAVVDEAVVAEPGLFEHVVENLLLNAVRHTPPGTSIRIEAEREDDLVRLRVRDDGPGIPVEELTRLTQRFYRGGSEDGRAPGGVGLGLALCEQILAAHGTTLEISSEPGSGTEFGFTLPLAVPATVSATSARSPR